MHPPKEMHSYTLSTCMKQHYPEKKEYLLLPMIAYTAHTNCTNSPLKNLTHFLEESIKITMCHSNTVHGDRKKCMCPEVYMTSVCENHSQSQTIVDMT